MSCLRHHHLRFTLEAAFEFGRDEKEDRGALFSVPNVAVHMPLMFSLIKADGATRATQPLRDLKIAPRNPRARYPPSREVVLSKSFGGDISQRSKPTMGPRAAIAASRSRSW